MKSATEQLREELFDTLHRLKTGQIDAALIGTENLQSLNGLTPEEYRAATGGVVHRLK